MEPVLLEDLVAVATLDSGALYVRQEDKDKEDALGLLVFCDNSMTCQVGLVQVFLKTWPLDILEDNKILHEYYQDRIGKTFQGISIYNMLTMFKENLEKWESMENRWKFETSEVFDFNVE